MAVFLLDTDCSVLVTLVGLDIKVNDDLLRELGSLKDNLAKDVGSFDSKARCDSRLELEVGCSLVGLPVINRWERVLMSSIWSEDAEVIIAAMTSSRDSLGCRAMGEGVEQD